MTEQVWFRHPERCWSLGDIKQLHGTQIEVREVETGTIYKVPSNDTHPCDSSHLSDNSDIAAMNNMHEGPLLALLYRRYFADDIYTFTGDILISINPYKHIPGLYTIPEEEYKEKKVPHVFSVAEKTYVMMLEETNPSRKNQSMIVSGESGAGKTEACKHIMKYLATLSQRYTARQEAVAHHNQVHALHNVANALGQHNNDHPPNIHIPNDKGHNEIVSIETKVLDCNPFLEAFGNAKTVRNDNSSRFGKFLKIEYDGGHILGARIRHYLLEKARVVSPQAGERNYHIFYQLARGATPTERKELKVGNVEDYAYLTSGGMEATFVDGVDDVAEFTDVRNALTAVGMVPELQKDMYRLISGLMHLGNVKFTENTAGEAVLVNPDAAATAGELLGCPALPIKLVRRLMKVKGRRSAYDVALNAKQGAVSRDSLAKATYERMFSWLIYRTNLILTSKAPSSGFIGILDIFGFEIFQVNSFEQLCINYANEKLQNLFNHHIFVMEQEAYAAEGVDVTAIQFVNNQPCVDLIEKKPIGLLPLLDEICYLGRETTDQEYLDKIDKAHKGKHEYYGNPKKKAKDTFSVLHFAGEVTYSVNGFIEKNNDTLYTDLEELMMTSQFQLVRDVFDDSALDDGHTNTPIPEGDTPSATKTPAKTAAAPKQKTSSVATIASKFKTQLGALNDTLLATTPHYVRCVKPNKFKKALLFDHPMILAQLLYSGVLETVRIRRQGFPFRETFVEFWRRACRIGFVELVNTCSKLPRPSPPEYVDGADGKAVDKSLTPELVNTSKQATILLCQHFLSKAEWTLGKNKIFMKDGCLDKIMKQFRTYHTTRIQSWWRMVKILRKYKRYRRAVKRMQRGWRAILLQRRYAAVASKITRLQAHIRRRIQQRRWKRIKAARANAGAIVKSYIRGNYDRKRYRKLTIGFQALQQKYRTYRYHKKFMKIRKYIRIIQSYVKMYLARKRYLRIRYVQANGCKLIQAKWRGYKNRKDYKLTRKSAITFQRRWRYRTAVLLRRKLFAIVVKLQSMCKAWKIRSKYRIMKRRATQIQAWWRMLLVSKAYRKQKRAVRIIEQAILQVINRRSLTKWVQDLHAAANWGDSKELEIILLCRRPEHYRIGQTIPNVGDRVKIRNRYDGFKSILHAAAAGGDVNAVKFLISRGAEPGTLDSFGATPLHKAASMGDSHLPVLQLLASLFTNPKAVLNHPNMAGETVIDTAIFSARNSGYGRREHDTTIKFLLDGGSEPTVCGLSSGQVMNMVNAPKPGAMAAAAAAARERELLERRAKERREDPHYQLLFVSEAERKRKAEAVASKGYINEVTGERHRQEAEQHELKKQSSIRNVLQELGSDDITISTATVTNKTLTSSVVQAYVTPNSNTTQLSPTSMKKSLAEQYAEASLQDQSRKEQANTLKNEKITNARLIASQAYALQSNALDQQPVRPPVLGSPNVNTNNKTITIFNASPTSSSTAPSSSLLSETVNKSQTSKALLSNPSFSTASFTPTTSNANAYTNNDNKDPATFVASSLSSLIATGEKGRHPNRNVLGTHGTTPSQPTILPSVDISTLSSVSSPYNTNGTKPTVNTTFSPAISSPTNSDTYFSPVHTYLGSPDNKLEVASSNGSMNKSISILPTTTSLTNVPFVNANSNNVVSRPISLLNSTNSNRAISPVRPTSLAELDSIPPPRSIHQHSIIPSQSVTSPFQPD